MRSEKMCNDAQDLTVEIKKKRILSKPNSPAATALRKETYREIASKVNVNAHGM